MRIRLEALPADILGLGPEARSAWSTGRVGGLPVARSLDDIPVPEERLTVLERSELVAGLRAGLAPHDPPSRVETSLRLLEEEGTACVVTGQQAGFLGGPLYTLLKALQTCRLAAELGERWGRPVVPIFWNHGDDHDWGEVAHACLLNRNQDLQKLALQPGEGAGRQPVGRLPLSDREHGLEALRAAVSQAFEEHGPAAEAVQLLFPREGEALTQALTRALTTLLGARGLEAFENFHERPGWAIDLHQVGYLFVISEAGDLAAYEQSIELQHRMGIQSRLLTPREAHELSPGIIVDDLLAAAFHPRDGYCSPESVVHGYAAGARRHGAIVRTGVTVEGIEMDGPAIVAVHTSAGVVRTSTVVCAAGAWSKEIGALAGVWSRSAARFSSPSLLTNPSRQS